MSNDTLAEFVEATANRFEIPGVAVGVWADGHAIYACHGVTSVDNRVLRTFARKPPLASGGVTGR